MTGIGRPRRAGKTTLLVEELRKNPKAAIVVPSILHKQDIVRHYALAPDEAKRVISMREGIPRMHGLDIDAVWIDNLDMLLQGMFDFPVAGFTFTGRNK